MTLKDNSFSFDLLGKIKVPESQVARDLRRMGGLMALQNEPEGSFLE